MILCDIGNTTFHFKTTNKNFKVHVNRGLDNLKDFDSPIYYISVNTNATKKLLKKYPNAINLEDIIKFETSYVGLGIDRQVVCSGVNHGIIIDMGSAITVDVMRDKAHLGGFILPGIEAYKEIYPQISPKLTFKFKSDINLDKIPQNTSRAINYAILESIVQPILKIYHNYNLPLYFTGEHSQYIIGHFKNKDKKYEKDLVFKCMKKIIKKYEKKENRC
jgi:type III pantothenate kinase